MRYSFTTTPLPFRLSTKFKEIATQVLLLLPDLFTEIQKGLYLRMRIPANLAQGIFWNFSCQPPK